MEELLTIGNKTFSSRLLLGSSRYPSPKTLRECISVSGTEIVTVSIRRLSLENRGSEGILNDLINCGVHLLPNTAGCTSAHEAVLTAQLAREALGTSWIKLEVIGDENTLYPDIPELLTAARILVDEGFTVLPYCSDDPVACRKLADIGCAAVMPLASPIGSGMGIRNPHQLQLIREMLSIPLIVDAGIGTASDAAIAMEMGYDAVLVNTAVAQARHPVAMAKAMKLAVEAGRLAYQAGRIPPKPFAAASSPREGKIAYITNGGL